MAFIVHPHFHPRRTGATRHVEDIVRGLEPRAVASGSALMPSVPQMGLTQIWRRLNTEPTIWHAHRLNELQLGLLFRWLRPSTVRVVFTRHASTKASWWTRFWAQKADVVIALTDEARENLKLSATRVIGHGVDVTAFVAPTTRSASWAALNQGGQRGVGVVGRIRPAKGQGDFVDAIAPLLPSFPEWKAVLIGRIKPSERAWADGLREKTASALGLIDEQANILPWYQGLSLVVQPSHTEGFSLVLLEAMASGCCVIATRLAYANLVEHGRTGWLYEPGDVAGLRTLLQHAMSHPDEVARLGEAARALVVARCGVETEAAALGAVYDELASKMR